MYLFSANSVRRFRVNRFRYINGQGGWRGGRRTQIKPPPQNKCIFFRANTRGHSVSIDFPLCLVGGGAIRVFES